MCKFILAALIVSASACAYEQDVAYNSASLTKEGNIDVLDTCRKWHVTVNVPYGWAVSQNIWEGTYDLSAPSGAHVEYPRVSDTRSFTVAEVSVETLGDNQVTSATFQGSTDKLYSVSGHFDLQTQEGLNFSAFLSHGATPTEMNLLLSGFRYESL